MSDELKPSGLLPFVRHILVCEHAEAAPNNPRRANIYGVFANVIVGRGEAAFPSRIGFTVYVMLSDCRRSGSGRITVTEAASGEACYNGVPFRWSYQRTRSRFMASFFESQNALFPVRGYTG